MRCDVKENEFRQAENALKNWLDKFDYITERSLLFGICQSQQPNVCRQEYAAAVKGWLEAGELRGLATSHFGGDTRALYVGNDDVLDAPDSQEFCEGRLRVR